MNKDELRHKAEKINSGQRPEDGDLSYLNMKKLVHELEVHQIELELQNEELKAAIFKLDEQERKYQKLFNDAPVGYIIINNSKEIIQTNNTFSNLIGFKISEIDNHLLTDFIQWDDKDIFYLYFNQLHKDTDTSPCHLRLMTKSDDEIHVSIHAYKHEGDTFRISVTDISKLEVAEKINKIKNEFLSRLSHELRTPLNSILGFSQLLEMSELDIKQRKGVDHILKSGKLLLDLINDVLDVSKIENGRLDLVLEPVKMRTLADEVIDIVRPMADLKNIEFNFTNSDSEYVIADKKYLKQVLLNLINNAVKYNNQDGKITFNSTQIKDETNLITKLKFSIQDTGIGIKQCDVQKLFMPFERIFANTKIEGSGLGLIIVKKLIKAMHGTVGFESEFGIGSTFWIELPYHSELKSAV